MNTEKIISLPPSEVLQDLTVRPIFRQERPLWDAAMRQHHYLVFHFLAWQSLRYMAVWQGQWLALLSWAAALKGKVRIPLIPATHSGAKRPPVPEDSGWLFRAIPDTPSGWSGAGDVRFFA